MTDDELRAAYATSTPLSASASPHPTEDEWERFALPDVSTEERDRITAHVAECRECASIYSAVAEVMAGGREIDRASPGARPTRVSWPFGIAAAAALALFMIAPWRASETVSTEATTSSAISPQSHAASGPDRLRSTSGNEPVPTEPQGRLSAKPIEFRFHAGPEARAHVIRLYDASGTLIWTSTELPGETCPWPREIAAKPGRYFWQVFAVPTWSRDTKDLIASPQVDFEIAG